MFERRLHPREAPPRELLREGAAALGAPALARVRKAGADEADEVDAIVGVSDARVLAPSTMGSSGP